MYDFCTYFDRNYLLRGLTLYRSLGATGCPFRLHVLALDDETANLIGQLAMPNIYLHTLEELEEWAPALLTAKANRRTIEYYFTLTPQLPIFVFERHSDSDVVTYLDADLYFYASPKPLFDEFGARSILVTPHRYPDHLKAQEVYGLFNVQYQSFRRDETGMACLSRWRDQCLAWCYDRAEDGKYGDQKYLDEWPLLYGEKLTVLKHRGGGLAPWNWATYPLRLDTKGMTVGGDELIFFHFHGLKVFNPYFASNGLADWGVMPRSILRWLYVGYIRELRRTRTWLRERSGIGLEMRDRFIRGGGVSASVISEIMRKAWIQAVVAI